MTATHEKRNDVRLNDADTMIGKYLVHSWDSSSTPTGRCLTCAELARFIDGSVNDTERATMTGHLADCKTCRHGYAETLKGLEELAECSVEVIHSSGWRRRLYFAVPTALAAGLALFLLIRGDLGKEQRPVSVVRNLQPPSLPTPETKKPEISSPQSFVPASRTPVREEPSGKTVPPPVDNGINSAITLLAANVQIDKLSSVLQNNNDKIFGFTGSGSSDKFSFRLGAALVDLEVASRAGDKAKFLAYLDIISGLVVEQPEFKTAAERSQALTTALKKGETVSGAASEISTLLAGKADGFFLKFGAWVEGGILASRAGVAGYANAEDVRRFRAGIAGKDLPQGVEKALAGIEEIVVAGKSGETDIRKLLRYFESVREML